MKVLIFGTGDVAGKILEDVEKQYEIIGFLDNSVKKRNTYYDKASEYYIYSPDEVDTLDFDKVIIASSNYASEMFSQLLGLGVREHEIIVDYVCKSQDVYLYDLLKMQKDTDGCENRLDIAVKYMAVDSYMKKDKVGIELYICMQKKRLGLTDEEAYRQWEIFKELIDSIDDKGYDSTSYIICDEKMRIMDGAHRVAICLYFDIYRIPIKMTPKKFQCKYGIEWFWENDFSREEIIKIERINKLLVTEIQEEIMAFIWPSAVKYVDEIVKDLSYLTVVKERKHVKFETEDDFQHFVRGIYSVDDIEMWKIEKKLEHMGGSDKKVEVLTLHIETPDYRLKASSGLPISVKVEKIKKIIRDRYREKVEDYYYDNIIHIADNYYQSRVIKKIITLGYDISEAFENIANEKYALAKMEVPYMPKNFPIKYPIHKDSDILCAVGSFETVSEELRRFANMYAERYELNVRELEKNNCLRIRIEYLDFLIYQFDISYKIDNLDSDYVGQAVENREKYGNYYILSSEDEIIIRDNEIKMHPEKKYHMQYLMNKK